MNKNTSVIKIILETSFSSADFYILSRFGRQKVLRVGANSPHALIRLTKSALFSSLSNSVTQTQQIVAIATRIRPDTAFLLLARATTHSNFYPKRNFKV
jgi:PhoPQ-activated pathogenicity-related protein